jgi:hypothetical protein
LEDVARRYETRSEDLHQVVDPLIRLDNKNIVIRDSAVCRTAAFIESLGAGMCFGRVHGVAHCSPNCGG